jgi:SHS2 domain-containing protein
MDHVPLPQRPPRRKRPRLAPADAADAPGDPSAGARAAAATGPAGEERAGVPGEARADARDQSAPTPAPAFVPGVPVFDGTSASPRYEYRDHTADIQIHSWGASVEECFAWAALGMFNYMTPLENLRASAAEAAEAAREGVPGDVPGDASKPGRARVPGNRNMRKPEKNADAKENADASHADTSVGFFFEVEAHDMQSLLFAFLDELLFKFHTSMTVCREVQLNRIDRERWRLSGVARGETFVDGVHEQGTEIKAITYSAMQIVERGAENDDEANETLKPASGDEKPAAEVFVIVDI